MKSYKEEELEYKSGFRKLVDEYAGRATIGSVLFLAVFAMGIEERQERAKEMQNNLEKTLITDTIVNPADTAIPADTINYEKHPVYAQSSDTAKSPMNKLYILKKDDFIYNKIPSIKSTYSFCYDMQ